MSASSVYAFDACWTFTDLISLNEMIHDDNADNPAAVTVAANGGLMAMTDNVF